MRLPLLVLSILFLAGCAGPERPTTTPEPTSTGPTGPAPNPNIAECKAAPNGTAHATPSSNIPTQTLPNEKIAVTVAHRDGVARYDTDGMENGSAVALASLDLEFAPGLGYRFVADGSAVYDQRALHRFGADLRRTASWNATDLGGVAHAAPHYYAVADGKLHVLSEQLTPVHNEAIPNWTAPHEPGFDVVHVEMDLLLVGTRGRPSALLAYHLTDRAKPSLVASIEMPRSKVPVDDATTGTTSSDPSARQTPWTDASFSHIVLTSDSIYVWRDGTYQGDPAQTVSRFQDFVHVRRTNLSVVHHEQQYLEDHHHGWTNGAHVGPLDRQAEWTLLHTRGTFSLAYLVQTPPRVFPACHVDVHMSSFAPEDAFFHRKDARVLLGTEKRIEAWDVRAEPGKIAEAKLPRPATDARWT